jgi:hypothetical protein
MRYAIEKTIRGQSAGERRAVRQEKSRPLVLELKIRFEQQLARVSAKSLIAEAIGHALHHWDGLTGFLPAHRARHQRSRKKHSSLRSRSGCGESRGGPLVDVRLHDLRHTYASFGAGGGLGLPIVGRLLGHTQTATTARYAHLDNDPLRRASESIAGRIAASLDGDKTADRSPSHPRNYHTAFCEALTPRAARIEYRHSQGTLTIFLSAKRLPESNFFPSFSKVRHLKAAGSRPDKFP